uniref:Uncharacterized protein n=1 Tax=Triticum urartu TaxID=4572 RepID=A0A8R7P5K6_TRIUA
LLSSLLFTFPSTLRKTAQIASLIMILSDLKADSEEVLVEEKIDQGMISSLCGAIWSLWSRICRVK